MDDNRENLICLDIADLRERKMPLSPDLHSHAFACPDCEAAGEVDELFARYEPLEMRGFTRGLLWEKIAPKKSFWSLRLPSYAFAMAMTAILALGFLLILRSRLETNSPTISMPATSRLFCFAGQVMGAVQARNANGAWVSVVPHARLAEGSDVHVSSGGVLRIIYPGQTEIALIGDSEGIIREISGHEDQANRFYLVRGKMFVHHRGNPFVAETPTTLIEAIGTEFSVRHEGMKTEVRVFHGRVRVRSGHQNAIMNRTERILVVPGKKLALARFRVHQVEPWEALEVRRETLKNGRWSRIQEPRRLRTRPPRARQVEPVLHGSSELVNRSQNYSEHADRLRVNQEHQIQTHDEEVHKKVDALIKEQQQHDEELKNGPTH